MAGSLSGRTRLEWPLGRFVDRQGSGDLFVSPPEGIAVVGRSVPHAVLQAEAARPQPWGPFNADPRILGEVPLGGELHFRLDPEWITLAPSTMATPRTFVAFEGKTAYGDRSEIPFHVTSADWQESDRVLAGIMTAFGATTSAVPVGGSGEFDGVMRLAFRRPRIEGRFRGDRLRAWDVTWGRATGDLVIEDAYVSITNARVAGEAGVIETEGRFALGYPRKDGGEEINARIKATRWPLADLRHAFLLDDWPLEGVMSGEFHLYGKYQRPYGFGRLQIDRGSAWREAFETATTSLRFEGEGVRLDAIEAKKSGGAMTGAAYVGWDGIVLVQRLRSRRPGRDSGRAEVPADAAIGTAGLHGLRQRSLRIAALRRPARRRGPLHQGRRGWRPDDAVGREEQYAQPRDGRRVAAARRIWFGSDRADAAGRRRTDVPGHRHVAGSVRPDVPARTLAVYDGGGQRHRARLGRVAKPRSSAGGRADRRAQSAALRLRRPERRPGACLLRSAGDRDQAASAGWRRHAPRRRRHHRSRGEFDRDQGHRRREPRDSPGVHARRPQLGTGRSRRRDQRQAGRAGLFRAGVDRRRPHPSLLAAALARCHQRPTRLRRRPACGSTG